MKIMLMIMLGCMLVGQVNAQAGRIDTVAVSILDRMSVMMGELKSCSATVRSNYDVTSRELGLIKHSDEEHIYFGGPEKLLVRSEGDKGNRSIVYNGKTLSYYSLDKNYYSQTNAPANVMEMINKMNKDYGIVFPMADFFYPSFVDDILADATDLVLLSMTKVNGKDCYHIAGNGKDKTFQFWISDDMFYLPMKLVIVYKDKPMDPQYEAAYTDWQLNPDLPNSLFEFKIPPNARKIRLTPLLSAKK